MKKTTSRKMQFALSHFHKVSTKLSENVNRDLGRLKLLYTASPDAVKLYKKAQGKAYLKKFASPVKGDQIDEKHTKTFNKFQDVNKHMAAFTQDNLFLPDDRRTLCGLSIRNDVLLRARLIARSILTPFTEDEWFRECKNSAGSSIGVPYVDTSDERKFTFPISCTQRIPSLFDRYFTYDSVLREAIQGLNDQFPKREMYQLVEGSRATTVPKDDTIHRMIAIEPTGNMFFQQGLMQLMYRRLADYGLDVATLPQEHSKLAFRGSITGLLATVDFADASNCVSRDFLSWLIPPSWFRAVDKVTCRSIKINDTYEPTFMFSTMGNAGTFPLETIVFYSLAMASHLHVTRAKSNFPDWDKRNEVSVFGDDCILSTKAAPIFMDVAESVGFKVNREKSFFTPEPGFRESCGSDYYRGVDVRPFYFKGPHSLRRSSFEPWLYTCMNKIIKKYIRYFGSLTYIYDKAVFRYFKSICDEFGILVKLIPSDFPDDAGLKIAYDIDRFNEHYPGIKYSKVRKSKHGSYTFLFCKFNYTEKERVFDLLRYSIWLKKPILTRYWDPGRDPEHEFAVRRRGGYVVARAQTTAWYGPPC